MRYRSGVSLLLWLCGLCVVAAEDWPHWRGPQASGVSPEPSLPTKWSATENIAWKAPLAGAGISTPIVSGDRVYVTSQLGTGISRQGPRLVQGGDAAAMGERALRGAGSADPAKTIFIVEAFSRSAGTRICESGRASCREGQGG